MSSLPRINNTSSPTLPPKRKPSRSNSNVNRYPQIESPVKTVSATDDIEIIKRIGEAKFPVCLTYSASANQYYALKMFPFEDSQPHSCYRNEARFANLCHPNVIKMIHTEDETPLEIKGVSRTVSCILMDYAPYGDLFDFIKKHRAFINDKIVRTYFRHLIEGLEYLHSKKVWHLDIKPENLLIGKDGELLIADFDLSYVEGDRKMLTRGTKHYRAPELRAEECKDGAAADVYSAGVILFLLKSRGTIPHAENKLYNNINLMDLLKNDVEEFFKLHCKIQNQPDEFFEPSFRELFRSMLDENPLRRPSIAKIKRSKWYSGPVYTKSEFRKVILSLTQNE